jgi:hypothetical protein
MATVAVLGYLIFRGRKRPAEPTSLPPASALAPVSKRPVAERAAVAAPIPSVGPRGNIRRKRSYQRMLDSYLESSRYPPTSRPMSERETYRLPEAPPPALRSEDAPGGRKIEQRERQNMYYVAEGESAVVSVEVFVDGKPATDLQPAGASLSKLEGKPRVLGPAVTSTSLKDDGAPPDEHAKDGTLTATVPFPKDALAGFVGDMTLSAILRAGDTPITTTFGFMYTGHPPARFTGAVREAVEDGSLALYAEIQVEQDADYIIRARLYDSEGKALVVLVADGELEAGRQEVRFAAFGKLLRDLSAKSPYALRDAEAFVIRGDQYPDRLKVPTWPGPFVTRRYRLEEFSDNDWTSAQKQAEVAEIQRMMEAAPE